MSDVVITPTYNERSNVAALVERVFALNPGVSMLVVDDNSPDGTGAAVRELQAKYRNLRLLSRPGKLGFSSAYRDAFRYVLREFPDLRAVVTMDADLSHDPVAIARMLKEIDNCDLVIGSRYVPEGGARNWSLKRRALSRFANAYARTVSRTRLRDLTTGYVCYRAALLRRLDGAGFVSNGFSGLMELKIMAARMGARIREIPIVYVERTKGKSKLSRRIVYEGLLLPWRFSPPAEYLRARRTARAARKT